VVSIPFASASVPEWQRTVAYKVNPVLAGYVCPQYDAAPSDPSPGFFYYDTTLNLFRYWNDSAWVDGTGTAGTVVSVAASGGTTGLSFSGSPITSSGTLTLGGMLAVANGGTGSGTVGGARSNLGLVIGTDVQAYSAKLAAYASGDTPSAFTLGIVDSADAAAWRTAIGAGTSSTTGTVTSIDLSGGATGLTFSGGPVTTSGTITVAGTLAIANGGTGATTATNARSNLGVAIGSQVQAWDADLDALAALSGTNTIYYRSTANTWSAVTIGSDLSFSAGTLNVGAGTGSGSVVRATQPQFTSTIGVGTAASVSGSGVSFPATQSASTDKNTLDDYEEDVWTPTVAASSGTITTYTASGAYTKIGRKVSASVLINISNNGTGAGSISFTLPFTAGSGQWVGAGRENALTGNMLQNIVFSGGTTCVVLTYNGAYPGGTGSQIIASIDYFV